MKPWRITEGATRAVRTGVFFVLVGAGCTAVPTAALALPCSHPVWSVPNSCRTSPDLYTISFAVSTPCFTVTHIVDFYYGQDYLSGQGDFPADVTADPSKPRLPAGGGVLRAGPWVGEHAHFLRGLTQVAGADALVVIMSPAAATLMAGRSFNEMINGIPPLPAPPLYPQTNAELVVIDRLKNRGSSGTTTLTSCSVRSTSRMAWPLG